MVHAFVRRGRPALPAAALLVLAALLAAPGRPTPAQEPMPKVGFHKDVASDVPEMVQVINTHLDAGWKANKLTPARLADDYEFLRRATLDVIGRVAKPEEIETYLKDPRETRRSLLIERLLGQDEYADHWANLWSNWLLTRAGPFGSGEFKKSMHAWLAAEFQGNRPHNQIVTALLTATGKNIGEDGNGAANFILAHLGEPTPQARAHEEGAFDMVPITSRVTRLFLGVQTQCAQCHEHPFDQKLKQHHFWGVNTFFRQVVRDGNLPRRPRDPVAAMGLKDDLDKNPEGAVFFEKRNAVVLQTRAVFLDGTKLSNPAGNRRQELARLITESELFPRAYVNRTWAQFFGRGFTQPFDDFNDQNTVSHPELLAELSKKVKHYNFDQKKLIRWICHSNAYNLSCVTNPTNDKPDAEPYFARMLLKPMSPEELYESLRVATGWSEEAENKEDRRRRREDWLGKLITNFGDDEGNEVSFNGTIVQALLMMNGEDINRAISRKDKGTLASALKKKGVSSQRVMRDLYLATLNREPTSGEYTRVLGKLRMNLPDKDPTAPYQDLFWALLNSNEFLLNH